MITTDELATAALNREALRLCSLVQELMYCPEELSKLAAPQSTDIRLCAVAASIVELLAERANLPPPKWTADMAAFPEPYFLVAAAERLSSMRQLCEEESPEPLRRRRLFAPPNFLTWV